MRGSATQHGTYRHEPAASKGQLSEILANRGLWGPRQL